MKGLFLNLSPGVKGGMLGVLAGTLLVIPTWYKKIDHQKLVRGACYVKALDFGIPSGVVYCTETVGEHGITFCESGDYQGQFVWQDCGSAITWHDLGKVKKVVCPIPCAIR